MGCRNGARFTVAGTLALLALGACRTWKPSQINAQHEFVSGRARVRRADSTFVVMVDPRLVGDSVVGTLAGTRARMAIAFADVRLVEVSRVDPGTTALALTGIATLYFIVWKARSGLAGST